MKSAFFKFIAVTLLLGFSVNVHAQEGENQEMKILQLQIEKLRAELEILRAQQSFSLQTPAATAVPNPNSANRVIDPNAAITPGPQLQPTTQFPTPVIQQPPQFAPVFVQPQLAPFAPGFVERDCFRSRAEYFVAPSGWGIDTGRIQLNFNNFGRYNGHQNHHRHGKREDD